MGSVDQASVGRPISIRANTRIAWDLGKLIADELDSRDVGFAVRTSAQLRDELISDGYSVEGDNRRSVRSRLAGKVQTHLVRLLFAGDFSVMWDRRRRQESESWLLAAADLLRGRLAVGYPKLNRFVDRLTGIVFGRSFDGVIVQITPSWLNEELTDPAATVIAVVESWDHYCKMPTGYYPDLAVCWNQRLMEGWCSYQGARTACVGYPHKLSYASQPLDIARSVDGPFVYAFTTSSDSPLFEEELELVRCLALHFRPTESELLLKFKPTDKQSVQDRIAQELNVECWGATGSDDRNGANYSLTEEYNTGRRDLLAGVRSVISFGTTFALDAAAMGVPVTQLDIRNMETSFPGLADAASNEHLANLLYPDGASVFRPFDRADLGGIVSRIVSSPHLEPTDFTAEVRAWLLPSGSSADAIEELCTYIEDARRLPRRTGSVRQRWLRRSSP